jgi:hypothetical protein
MWASWSDAGRPCIRLRERVTGFEPANACLGRGQLSTRPRRMLIGGFLLWRHRAADPGRTSMAGQTGRLTGATVLGLFMSVTPNLPRECLTCIQGRTCQPSTRS